MAAGWDIRLIEFGKGYQIFNSNIGGQYLIFEENNSKCLNFFTYINTSKVTIDGKEVEIIHEDEYDTIIPCIGLMMGMSLKNVYKSDISEEEKLKLTTYTNIIRRAVAHAFAIHHKSAGMKEVGEALEDFRKDLVSNVEDRDVNMQEINILHMIITALENYTKPGSPYFKYYNGINNVDVTSKHFVAELDEIADKPILPVVAMGLLQRMAQEAFVGYLKNKGTSRIIGIDEAWKVLNSKIFVEFLEDFARRIRKYNGMTLIITQRTSDFFSNKAAEVIYTTASFKIFLPSSNQTIETDLKHKYISLNNFQTNLFKSTKTRPPHYNEAFIQYQNATFVVLTKVNVDDYWTFTSKPSDRTQIEIIRKEKGYSLSDAVWYLARKSEGLKEEEIQNRFNIRKKKGNYDIDWNDFFAETLNKENILISEQNIYNIENKESIGKELLLRIKYKGQYYTNGFFKTASKDKNFYIDISKIFVDKCLRYATFIGSLNEKLSINLDIDEIKNKNFQKFLYDSIDALEDRVKEKLIFDVMLNYETKENINELISFAFKLKEKGVQIALDNIDFGHLDIKTLISLKPSQYKINLEDLKEILEDEVSYIHAKSLIYALLNSSKDVKTVLVRVENKEDEELLREFDIKYAQGYLYDKPQIVDFK